MILLPEELRSRSRHDEFPGHASEPRVYSQKQVVAWQIEEPLPGIRLRPKEGFTESDYKRMYFPLNLRPRLPLVRCPSGINRRGSE